MAHGREGYWASTTFRSLFLLDQFEDLVDDIDLLLWQIYKLMLTLTLDNETVIVNLVTSTIQPH